MAGIVNALTVAPRRRLLPEDRAIAEVEFDAHIAPQHSDGSEAEMIICCQNLLVGDEGIVRPISPGDVLQFEVLIRTRPDDNLPLAMSGDEKREHHPDRQARKAAVCSAVKVNWPASAIGYSSPSLVAKVGDHTWSAPLPQGNGYPSCIEHAIGGQHEVKIGCEERIISLLTDT